MPNFFIRLSLAIDRMSLVQKLKGNYTTFDELSNALFGKILMEKSQWKYIDFIFNLDTKSSLIKLLSNKWKSHKFSSE